MTKRALITGHEGYIGAVMVPFFLEAGYEVTGLDTGYYRQCTLGAEPARVPTINKDIRELMPEDVEGFDAVVHLAALSNDQIGNLNREWTEEINLEASIRLARLAKRAGVRRFLFSSSCIMYGMSETAVVDEQSPLDPKTEYAISKVKAEQAISRLADDNFSPTFLRNGTVYGSSPRMRFDTVLNNLVGSAITRGEIVLYSDGKPWRPVVHVQDVARSFLEVLNAPIQKVHNQAFNNGAEHLNCQIIELADRVVELVPKAKLKVLAQPGADQRTYKADFGKFALTFPNFRFRWTVEEGARELVEQLSRLELDQRDYTDPRFTRLAWLRHLLDSGALDHSLRWRTPQRSHAQ